MRKSGRAQNAAELRESGMRESAECGRARRMRMENEAEREAAWGITPFGGGR